MRRPKIQEETYLKPKEVAEIFRTTSVTILARIRRGEIPAVPLPGASKKPRVLIPKSWVDKAQTVDFAEQRNLKICSLKRAG